MGYLDQERPLYRYMKVGAILEPGRHANRTWDAAGARRWLEGLGIGMDRRIRSLSVGQSAQVALALCLAKRPALLLLDEPAASLDPVARHHLWSVLMEAVAQGGRTVVVSSHIVSELEPVCDHLLVLTGGRTALAGDVDDVVAGHRVLTGPAGLAPPVGAQVVWATTTARQATVLVRGAVAPGGPGGPGGWQVLEPTLEEIVLAYLTAGQAGGPVAESPPGAGAAPGDAGGWTQDPGGPSWGEPGR